jgi:hypothetical protein
MKKWIYLLIWIGIILMSNLFNINGVLHLPTSFVELMSGLFLIIIYFGTNPPSDNTGDYEYFLKF